MWTCFLNVLLICIRKDIVYQSKFKGLNAANNARKLSFSYRSYRDLTKTEDTILSPDLTESNDFTAIDFCKAKSLLWGCLQRKSENSATHKNLLQIPHLLAPWRSFSTSATRTQGHFTVIHYGSVRSINCQELLFWKKWGKDLIFIPLWSFCTAQSVQKGCKARELGDWGLSLL